MPRFTNIKLNTPRFNSIMSIYRTPYGPPLGVKLLNGVLYIAIAR